MFSRTSILNFCPLTKRLEVAIRRGIRSGLCDREHPTLEQLVEDADDKVFTYVLQNQQHILHTLLPGTTEILTN